MALVGIKTDSRYNPNFPNINFLLHGRLVKIPSNYDPVARTYAAGIWKGDFKEDWTNNPAWIFYDLVTNKQIGLGERLGDFGVDKFQLYQIAQYCDQLVPDGYGGQEPRMTANLWITDQRSAYEVLSDMASVFRAMVIWNGQQMTATQDRPADPVCTYTQSNVIDGKFTRQYVAQKAIYTAVEVEYADKRNMYQKAIEYVADDDLIQRYGYNVKKITAFACTSRGQAHRYGKWVLETSRLEQCTITFSVGREGLAHLPGDIIEVADNRYANTNLGGRVLSINGKTVTLDRPIDFTPDSYLGYLSTEDVAEIVRVKILSVDDKQRVNLEREPAGLVENANWTLHTAQVKTQLYRAIGIAENEDGSFAITALQHEPQKESIVDNGANFEPSRSTLHQGGLVPPSYPDVTTDGGTIKINFQPPPNFVGQGLKYQVKLYRNGNLYKVYDDLQDSSLAFNDLPDGEYVAEIRAKNSASQLSEPITKAFSVNFNITQLVTVSKVFGIDLIWKNPLFAAPNASIEIWVSKDNNFANARKLITLAYPTNSYSYTGLGAAETYYFWARMVSKDVAGKFTDAIEGVTERDATKIVDYIHGQINKSALTQELVSEINDISEAAQAAKSVAGNASAKIEVASRKVEDVTSKFAALHTIKTQVVAGGRTAIAGIALGASSDGKTAESSVIVMADKFGVVKNATDGTVRNVFTVANNQLAISGDLLADGSIIGRHIRANAEINAPVINGGAISGNTITGSVVNGGVINSAEINGGVINGVTINGADGNFTGKVYANKIEGDLVKTFICPLNKQIEIPPALINRTIIVMPFEIFGVAGVRKSKGEFYYTEATLLTKIKLGDTTFDDWIQTNGLRESRNGQTVTVSDINTHLAAGSKVAVSYRVERQTGRRIARYGERERAAESVAYCKYPDFIIILALPS
jgi:phage-related protein tail component-like protein